MEKNSGGKMATIITTKDNPDLVNQLEGNKTPSQFADENTIAQLEKNNENPTSSILNKALNYSGTAAKWIFGEPALWRIGKGVAHGALSLPIDIANAVGANIKNPIQGSGALYQTGNILGNLAGFGGGTGLAKIGLKGLAEVAPEALAKGLQWGAGSSKMANFLRDLSIATPAGAGANPENKGAGALWGAGLTAAVHSPVLASSIIKSFQPSRIAKQIQDSFSPENIEQAQKVAGKPFNDIRAQVGDQKIYPQQVGENLPTSEMQYPKYAEQINEGALTGGVAKMNKRFLANPTFSNAHDLQWAIGDRMRALDKLSVKPAVENTEYTTLETAKEALLNDMHLFLNKINPTLSNLYNSAKENYATNFIPIRQIGELIKKMGYNPTPENMIKVFRRAQTRYGQELPEQLETALQTMENKIKTGKFLTTLGGLIAGSKIPAAGELAGAGLGALKGQVVAKTIGKAFSPLGNISFGNIISNALRQGTISNLINTNQQGQ